MDTLWTLALWPAFFHCAEAAEVIQVLPARLRVVPHLLDQLAQGVADLEPDEGEAIVADGVVGGRPLLDPVEARFRERGRGDVVIARGAEAQDAIE